MQRREFLRLSLPATASVLPLFGLSLVPACGSRKPETPLAHLYGPEWVDGAYQHYADVYVQVEDRARENSTKSYRLLAGRGVTALANLQAREVPFYIRVAADDQSFRVERNVPERLTLKAGMSAADRVAATKHWKLAREHVHTDYIETRRLDSALSTLLSQVQSLRFAADEGQVEQYRICRQLLELRGGGELPFELPYQVSKGDYEQVLELLVLRLERDAERMSALEASMVCVGLTARATDAGSGSLAANLNQSLLAVLRDAAALERVGTAYPQGEDLARDLRDAKLVVKRIQDSPEFLAWLAAQREAEDALGKLLVILDSVTGLPTSAVYRQVLRMWRGDADYLDYLSAVASLLPGGSQALLVVKTAVARTSEYRATYNKAVRLVGDAREVHDRIARGELGADGLLNTASGYARQRLDRQLVYLKDQRELDHVRDELRALEQLSTSDPEPAPSAEPPSAAPPSAAD